MEKETSNQSSVANFKPSTMWTGDNLPILRGINSNCIDLIYLDPPFNSNANYAAPIGSKAAGAEFKDTWTLTDIDNEWINLIESKHPQLHKVLLATIRDSDKSYLVYMASRILEMHRILKDTGSIYLHCDPTMSHYLKMVMDVIFGRNRFRNEIVWCYTSGGVSKRYFAKKHDVILFFAKSPKNYIFNTQYRSYSEGTIQRGLTQYKKNLNEKYELHEKGAVENDWWADIQPILSPTSKERTGYPTQKPLALLKRIIKASSNEGDVVLDPFAGCATTCVAAQDANRDWVGIDISEKAYQLVNQRLHEELGMFGDIISRTDIPQRTDLGKLPNYKTHKDTLYGEQGGDCAGCGTHFEARNLDVDHIIAKSKGGTDHIENLQLLCGACNSTKGDRGMEYLKMKLGIQ